MKLLERLRYFRRAPFEAREHLACPGCGGDAVVLARGRTNYSGREWALVECKLSGARKRIYPSGQIEDVLEGEAI